MTKMYYTPNTSALSDTYYIRPVPNISINTEIKYANDTIIGYDFIISLSGYASGYKHLVDDESDANTRNIQRVIQNIGSIRQILSRNGHNLVIMDDYNNTLFIAKGGQLRSLNFEPSDNNWLSYSRYTAEIVFNELQVIDETFNCNGSFINNDSITSNLVDIKKYKIKEFSDSWSFIVNDGSFNHVLQSDTNGTLNIGNSTIEIEYNISATGGHYYIGSGEQDIKFVPGWEQAKNFAQERLWDQVQSLSNNILKLHGSTCASTSNLSTIHATGLGVLGSGDASSVHSEYNIYNETINCDTSESDGTFSLVYKALLKQKSRGSFDHDAAKHIVSKTKNHSFEQGNKKVVSLSVNGTIEGLFAGGLIKSAGNFTLPKYGSLLIANNSANKFDNAYDLLSNLLNEDEDDLDDGFKQQLGITFSELNIVQPSCGDGSVTPKPSSFTLTKNHMEGTIEYSLEYNTNRACINSGSTIDITSISINATNPTPVNAEFVVPLSGVILYDLNTKTARTISYTIEGRKDRTCCKTGSDLNTAIGNYCGGIVLPDNITYPDEELWLLTEKKASENWLQGTFTINLSYTCIDPCDIT